MFDIITFGSATLDISLKSKKFLVEKNKKFIIGKGICFSLGSKIDVEEIYFASGGGGTNTAATFANQGFRVAYWGTVGDDIFGRKIIEELQELGIDTRFVAKTARKPTNQSVILNLPEKDRTILVYRGASEIRDRGGTVPQAKWFYLAPLSGKLANLTEKIVDFAQKNKIKVAFNPGNTQLSLPLETLKRILKKVDILILNQEEASLLTKIPYQQEEKIFQKIDEICPGIAVMTKGVEGVVVSDGDYLFKAKAPKIKVIDGTGAGDSFGSGFVSGFIKSKGKIKYAIQLAIANSASCLQELGAKNGLLKKDQKFKKVKIIKKKL